MSHVYTHAWIMDPRLVDHNPPSDVNASGDATAMTRGLDARLISSVLAPRPLQDAKLSAATPREVQFQRLLFNLPTPRPPPRPRPPPCQRSILSLSVVSAAASRMCANSSASAKVAPPRGRFALRPPVRAGACGASSSDPSSPDSPKSIPANASSSSSSSSFSSLSPSAPSSSLPRSSSSSSTSSFIKPSASCCANSSSSASESFSPMAKGSARSPGSESGLALPFVCRAMLRAFLSSAFARCSKKVWKKRSCAATRSLGICANCFATAGVPSDPLMPDGRAETGCMMEPPPLDTLRLGFLKTNLSRNAPSWKSCSGSPLYAMGSPARMSFANCATDG
mmetsp:Transcript_25679/g.78031  ORF Transcript_25679/g.78031 Transcript_25679/m.78031 type:complete len:338 (-) Transcript_25679:1230-2243(-)